MLILDLWGISFHAVVVFGLGKNLLFKSILGRCEPWVQGGHGPHRPGDPISTRGADYAQFTVLLLKRNESISDY